MRPSSRWSARALVALTLSLLCGALAAPAHADPDEPPPVHVDGAALHVAPASAGWAFTSTAGRTSDRPLQGLGLWRDGVATTQVTVPANFLLYWRSAQLRVQVGSDRCEGGADLAVGVDGRTVLHQVVDADVDDIPVPVGLTVGTHTVTFTYRGDHVADTCDRALKIYGVEVHAGLFARWSESLAFGPPSLRLSDQSAGLWHDLTGGSAETVLWKDATLTRVFTLPQPGHGWLVVDATSDDCQGPARVRVDLDGHDLATVDAARAGGVDLPDVAAGPHVVHVSFVNDLRTAACDRNLHVRRVTVNEFTPVPAGWYP